MKSRKNILHKMLEWTIYLWVFLLPWQTRFILKGGSLNGDFWEYGTFSLYVSDIFLFILLVLRIFSGKKDKFSLVRKRTQNLWPFLIGLLLVSFLSIYWAQDAGLSIYGFVKLAEGVIIFWIISTSRFSFKKIGWAFGGAVIIQSFIGIYQFIYQRTFAFKWLGMALQEASVSGTSVVENTTSRFLRAYGAFPHPNILAGFLFIGLIILIGLYFQSKKRNQQYFILVGFTICSIALFFTFSRATWLLIIIALLFHLGMVYLARKNDDWYFSIPKFIGIIFLVFFVFSPLYSNLIQTRLSLASRLEKQSIEQRLNYSRQATHLIKKHWVNGVGINNYTLAVHNEIDSTLSGQEYQPAHNVYLLVLAELGIFGFLVLLILLGQVLIKSWQVFYHYSFQSNNWSFVYSSALTAVLILFLFDHYFWTLSVGIMLFWLILGLWQKALEDKK